MFSKLINGDVGGYHTMVKDEIMGQAYGLQ